MNYTPRQVDAWSEVMERIGSYNKADAIDVARTVNADPKEIRSFTRKLREQL